MKSYIKLAVCLLLFGCSGKAQNTDPKYSEAIEKKIKEVENNLAGWVQIDDSSTRWNLAERMKFYRVKIHRGHPQLQTRVGTRLRMGGPGGKRPVTVQTLFQAGSISKSLNSVGLMKLVQERKIGLDDDINLYLQSWKFPYDSLSKNKFISLRNLLSHTAGLTVHGFPGYEIGDSIPTIYQILDGKKPANTGAIRSMINPD